MENRQHVFAGTFVENVFAEKSATADAEEKATGIGNNRLDFGLIAGPAFHAPFAINDFAFDGAIRRFQFLHLARFGAFAGSDADGSLHDEFARGDGAIVGWKVFGFVDGSFEEFAITEGARFDIEHGAAEAAEFLAGGLD